MGTSMDICVPCSNLEVATRAELIEVVAAERERVSGPAVEVLEAPTDQAVA